MALSFRFGTVGKPKSIPKKPGGSTPSPAAFRPRPLPRKGGVRAKPAVSPGRMVERGRVCDGLRRAWRAGVGEICDDSELMGEGEQLTLNQRRIRPSCPWGVILSIMSRSGGKNCP